MTIVSIAIAGEAFAVLPGDEISVTSAFGYALWMVLMALAAGSVAFALAQFVGRGAGAGIAGFVTIAGFIVNGYQAPVPELGPIADLTWFGWTVNHVPLAGQFDWPSVAFLAVFVVVLLAIGVGAFARRDMGATSFGAHPLAPASPGWPARPVEPIDRHEPARLDRVGPRHRRLRPRPGRLGQRVHRPAHNSPKRS